MVYIKKYYLAFLLLIISVDNLFSQKLSIETLLDTNVISIGDQIKLQYNIEKKQDVYLKVPVFSDTLANGVEVVGEPAIDSSKIHNELNEVRVSVKITSFDTGIYYIPPQPFIFIDHNLIDTLYSRAAYIMVQGVALDTTYTVRDIEGIEKAPLTIGEILLYILLILIVAGIGYSLYIFLQRKKNNKPMFKPLRPEEPAYITALRELDKIKALKLWQQKQVKEYYTKITYIIRWYIEKRFSIPALELTSDEILEHIRTEKLDNINYINLEGLLNLADLVKFAKGEPNPEENIIHLENAYDFVKRSKENTEESKQEEPTIE